MFHYLCLYIYNIQILYRFFSISLDKTSRYCGYIHEGRVNYMREFYLHDRSANRQRIRVGYIHDGRVNYIRELYYTTVTCGIDSTHGWGLPCK